jgi:hypothetical protein
MASPSTPPYGPTLTIVDHVAALHTAIVDGELTHHIATK